MSKTKHPVNRITDRPGEGAHVGITSKQTISVGGTTGMSYAVDMSSSPVPDRRYVADVASVVQDSDMVQLIFGQRTLGNHKLRSLVVIHMPGAAILGMLRGAEELLTAIDTFIAKFNVQEVILTDIGEEPSQTVALQASIAVASFSGRDACIDFYYSSPFVIWQVTKGGRFAVEPIVRVMLPTNLWRAVCAKCESIKATLPNDNQEILP